MNPAGFIRIILMRCDDKLHKFSILMKNDLKEV